MRYPGRAIFIGTALIYLALLPPGIPDVDANSMFALADSLADHGGFDVPCSLGVRGRGNDCYSHWYPLLSIAAVPFVLLGELIAGVAGLPEAAVERAIALIVPALAAAGAAYFTAMLARRFSSTWKQATLAAVAFAFTTEAIVYARSFFAETLVALLLAAGVWGVISDPSERGKRVMGPVMLALAILAKPQTVVAVGLLGIALGFKDRRLASFAPIASAAAGLGIYAAYNWVRFADPFLFRGQTPGELNPLHAPIGFSLLLVSPGRGIFIFSPIAIAGCIALYRMRRTRVGVASITACSGLLLTYAMLTGRGADWGDRYLLPALPFLCASLVVLRGRTARLAVTLGLIGALIQIPATASFWQRYYLEQLARGVTADELSWSITRTPLIGAWGAMSRQFSEASETDVSEVIEQSGESTADVEESGLMRTVAQWWWFLPAVGVSRWLGAAASVAAIAAGIALLISVWRRGSGADIGRIRFDSLPNGT